MQVLSSPYSRASLTSLSYGCNEKNKNIKNEVNHHMSKNKSINSGIQLKKNSLLESLINQKEKLMESKQTILDKSAKRNTDPASIKEKLEEIDKQMEEIDKQISKLQLEEQQKKIGTKNKEGKKENLQNTYDEDSSNNNLSDSSMENLLESSTMLRKTKLLSRQRKEVSSRIKVLNGEIRADEKRGINPTDKKEAATKLQNNMEAIEEKFGEALKDAKTKVKRKQILHGIEYYKNNSLNSINRSNELINITA